MSYCEILFYVTIAFQIRVYEVVKLLLLINEQLDFPLFFLTAQGFVLKIARNNQSEVKKYNEIVCLCIFMLLQKVKEVERIKINCTDIHYILKFHCLLILPATKTYQQ